MWKMAGWLGRAVAAGLIISFLSIWTTGYVVNSYVETLLKQYNIPLEQTPFAMSGVWGGLWGADQAPEKSASQETASGNQESENQESDNASQTGSEADSTAGTDDSVIPGLGDSSSNTDNTVTEEDSTAEAGDSSGSSSDGAGEEPSGNSDVTSTSETSGGSGTPPADEDAAGPGGEDTPLAVDAFGDEPGTLTDIGGGTGPKGNSSASSGSSGQTGEASEEGMAMTTDQLNAAKDSISDEDKQEMFSVIMKKLPADSWQRISTLIEGGLTAEEMTEVQQLIAQNLDRTEYDRMMEILKKY